MFRARVRHLSKSTGASDWLGASVKSEVVGRFENRIPSVAKAAIDLAHLTARLKPRPFKTNSN
jgi:hypothetical protein